MNGSEIERMLTLIDENVAENNKIVRQEIFDYFAEHQDEAVSQLRSTNAVSISTSLGPMTLSLRELRAAAA